MTYFRHDTDRAGHAIKAELIETARQWWTESGQGYIDAEDVAGAVDDLLITLEKA